MLQFKSMKPTSKNLLSQLLIFVITLQLVLAQVQLTVTSASASPNTARSSNSRYQINLSPITSFSTNFDISLAFTNAFSVTTVTGCSVILNGNALNSSTCSASSNVITFSSLGISATVSSLILNFNTSTALYSGSFLTTLTYYQPGNTGNIYNSNSALITITNAALSCTLTSTSNIVGATANYSLTYTPSVFISAGSLLQIQFPAWSAYTLTNFPSGTAASVCNGQCTIRNPNTGQGFLNQILTYSSLYGSDTTNGTTITMLNARNPASVRSISVTANILFFQSSTAQPSYMTCTATFQATNPGTFGSISFNPTSSAISSSSSISLFLSLANPISSVSYLSITYSSDLRLSYSYVTSNQQTTQVIVPSGAANTLLIGNLTNATSQVTSLFMASFTLINAPYAGLSNSVTFLSQNLEGGIYYSVDSRTVSLTSVTSTIVTASASLSNNSIGATSILTVSFTSVNTLITGSLVLITVPSEISLSSFTSCSTSITASCSLHNSSTVLITISAATVQAAASFQITISSVVNPSRTTPTSTFTIRTYYYNFSTPVDQLTSGLTIQAAATTLLSADLTPSSLTVAATSTYTITFKIRNALPAGSQISLSFPSDFSSSSGVSLTSFSSGGSTVPGCTLSVVSSMKFNFSNCFPSSIPAQTTLVLTLTNIINPLSTKPSASLQLQTYFNGYLMEYLYSGITTTMTTPAVLNFAAIVPTNTTVNAITSYLLSISFSQTHYSGDTILLTIPSTISLPAGLSCSTSTAGLTVACLQQSANIIRITMTGTVGSGIAVTIGSFQNNWYSNANTFTVQTTTNSSTNIYYVQQGTASATMTPASLSLSYVPTNALVLLSSSTLSIRINSPFTLSASNPSLLKITVQLPSDFTGTATCSASLSGSVCSFSGSTYTLSSLTAFTNTVNLTFTATAGYFTSSSTFISALSYNNSLVATDNTLAVSPFCISPCKGCTSDATLCTSCLPAPYTNNNYLFTSNSSCLRSCPQSYYLPSGSSTCTQCNTSVCLNCSGTASTCTACASPTYLFNSTCLLTCPNTYYGSGTTCLVCINQCYNCSNATYCLSCLSGYSLNPDSTCKSTCPSGYFSVSAVCTACTSPCSTCSGSLATCLSCVSGYILYNSTCVLACPLGKYKDNNNNCQNCISPCKFCLSETVCTSCITNYFLFNGSRCVATCPSGTYSLVSDCQTCNSSCQTCQSIGTNCTSCASGLYLYVGSCYEQCPNPTYPYQGICTTCVSPCATCLNGAYSCSTCQSGYLLLNTSCVLSCPSSGYTTANGSCVACPKNCVSCSSSTSCQACESGYYQYTGSCISVCPSSSPIIIDQVCTSCSPQCATCSQSPDNCLTCTLFYFRYSYTCVQSCPVSYYSNQLDYTCESGLSSKIVFFPVLITYLVFVGLVLLIKLFTPSTSIPTTITALSSWLELVIWIYLLSLLFASYLEPGLNYALPRALLLIAVLGTLICNCLHFKLNWTRLQQDQYVRKWQDININHSFLLGARYISLCTCHKFFRIIYSKIFHSIHFSLVSFKKANIFSVSTCFSIVCLLAAQIPVLAGAFYLTYNKLLKDQVFYSAVEVLIVTVASIIFELVDIYKPDDYFEDTEFMETKRYLEKVNNQSINKLEDQYRIKEEGSVDGEKQMGLTGGKFVFSKRGVESSSMNDLLFQEQSAITDAHDPKRTMKIQVEDIEMEDNGMRNEESLRSARSRGSKSRKSPRSPIFSHALKPHSQAKINIFQPIKEEQAEYYEVLKYDEDDFKTAAKIEKEKLDGNASEEDLEMEEQRKMEFGAQTSQEQIDDNISLMEYRERREEWNKIIDHRQKLAHQIFNTIDTKELYKMEPIDQEEEERYKAPLKQKVYNKRPQRLRKLQEDRQKFEQQLRRAKFNQQKSIKISEEEDFLEEEEERGPVRRKKARRPRRGNKQLQEIYLQRLAEKVSDPKRKTMYASSKSFKYQF